MSLSDLSSLGSFVSSVAVLVSLAYPALQTRQNVRHTKALIWEGSADRTTSEHLAYLQPGVAESALVGNGDDASLDAVRDLQFDHLCSVWYIKWDCVYEQHNEGLMAAERFQRLRWAMTDQLQSSPGIRSYIRRVVQIAPPYGYHQFLGEVLGDCDARLAAAVPTVADARANSALQD
jgi:hypothetical protein